MDEEPEFTTAADLRDGESIPAFEIPERPRRRFPQHGGVEYEGGTVFLLQPAKDRTTTAVADLLESVLERHEYRYGDWFDLPMPLYLVHDDGTNDTFRAAVRDGDVELHVRPETSSAGLRALYERLRESTDHEWQVDRRG